MEVLYGILFWGSPLGLGLFLFFLQPVVRVFFTLGNFTYQQK